MPCPVNCSSCGGSGEITEELQKEIQDKYILRFANFTPSSRVTRALISVNSLLFLVAYLDPALTVQMALKPATFSEHRYWELLTSAFSHAGQFPFGFLHLALNMSFLWNYGPRLEGLLGKGRFLAFYLASGVLASAVSWAGHTWQFGGSWMALGASGALFALSGAMLAIYWRWRMVPLEEVQQITSWALIILLGGIALEMSGYGFLDNWGHAGGMLGGFLIAAALPRPRGN